MASFITQWFQRGTVGLGLVGLAAFGCVGGDGGGGGGDAGPGGGAGGAGGGGSNASEGGSRLAGALFGGGENSDNPGGGAGGAGGGEPAGPRADAGTCQLACTQILACFSSACGIGIPVAELGEAVVACVSECTGASAAEVAEVSELTANDCAGFAQLAEADGLCEDFDDDDFTGGAGGAGGGGQGGAGGGGQGGAGGGGPPVGDRAACERACDAFLPCLEAQIPPGFEEQAAEELAEFRAECVSGCTAEATREELACVTNNAGNCDAMAACFPDDEPDDDIGQGGFGGGPGEPTGDCSALCAVFGECVGLPQAQCEQACGGGAFPAELISCLESNIDAGCAALEICDAG